MLLAVVVVIVVIIVVVAVEGGGNHSNVLEAVEVRLDSTKVESSEEDEDVGVGVWY